MKILASFMFAKSLIFPKTEKKSSARKSIFGAIFCIGLSLIPLILVISVSNGMIQGMTERIIGLSSSHLNAYISPIAKYVKSNEEFCEYVNEIKKIDGVLNAFPEIDISGLAVGKENRVGIQIRCVQNDIFVKNQAFSSLFNLIDGNLNDFSKKNIIIGKKLSEDLSLKIGDNIKIITTKSVNGKISPKLSTFSVSAIISSGYQELDQFWIFVPLESAYKNLSLQNASFNMMIETQDAFSSELVKVQQEVQNEFGRYANVYRWDEINSNEFENFASTKVMLILVMFLIVLVASINITAAITMLIMERKKEIGILKSVGATSKMITFSFLLTGISCSLGGIIIGVPLGVFISINANLLLHGIEWILSFFTNIFNGNKIVLMDPAYYLSEIQIELPISQIFLIILVTILLSSLVSIIPSIKAGKEKPLDIFRNS